MGVTKLLIFEDFESFTIWENSGTSVAQNGWNIYSITGLGTVWSLASWAHFYDTKWFTINGDQSFRILGVDTAGSLKHKLVKPLDNNLTLENNDVIEIGFTVGVKHGNINNPTDSTARIGVFDDYDGHLAGVFNVQSNKHGLKISYDQSGLSRRLFVSLNNGNVAPITLMDIDLAGGFILDPPTAGNSINYNFKFQLGYDGESNIWINQNDGEGFVLVPRGDMTTYNNGSSRTANLDLNYISWEAHSADIVWQSNNEEDFGIDDLYLLKTFSSSLTIGNRTGDVILGVDPDDDGSGSNSGGGDGLSGFGSGGIGDLGLVGGTITTPDTTIQISSFTGGSSWRGSGSAIDIIKWNYVRLLDEFGSGQIELVVLNNEEGFIRNLKNQLITIAYNNSTRFKGWIRNTKIINRYGGILALEEVHTVFQRKETELNFTSILQRYNDATRAVVRSVSSTQIGIFNSIDLDSFSVTDKAIMVIPGTGNVAASTTEDFTSSVVQNIDASTDPIGNINTNDQNYMYFNNTSASAFTGHPTDEATDMAVDFLGTYSGTRANVESFKLSARFFDAQIAEENPKVHLQMYNYITAAWTTIKSINYGRGTIGLNADLDWKEIPFTPTTATDYIKEADNEFKFRLTWSWDTPTNTKRQTLWVYFLDLRVFTDVSYSGNPLVLASASGRLFTTVENPITEGVNVGDTIVVGLKTTTALQQLFDEHSDIEIANINIDTGFTGYTTGEYGKKKLRSFDAISRILKKENGYMYYIPETDTLVLKKKDNLNNSGLIFSNQDDSNIPIKFTEQQNKVTDRFRDVEVTGASYKVADKNVKVIVTITAFGSANDPTLRITDDTILTETEATERANAEIAQIEDANKPVHRFTLTEDNFFENMDDLYPGNLYQVKRRVSTYENTPIRSLSVSNNGGGSPFNVIIEVGWKGTTAEKTQLDRLNQLSTDLLWVKKNAIATPNDIETTVDDLRDDRLQIVAAEDFDLTTARYIRDILEFFNGTIMETITGAVSSNGTVITFTFGKSGGGDMTLLFSDGASDLSDNSTGTLNVGTDTVPVQNFVYVLQSDRIVTVSTAGWPSAEHIKIATITVQSAVKVQADGALGLQLYNDHMKGTDDQGHGSHVFDKLRSLGATYISGVLGNGSDGYAETADAGISWYIKSTAGIVKQLHDQTYAAKDTTGSDDTHVVNDPTTPYNEITDLVAGITQDASGVALGVNKYFSLILWGTANLSGAYSPLFINLPTGTYNSASGAENDTSGKNIVDIPDDFQRTAFYIARITFKKTATGWDFVSEAPLLGSTGVVVARASSITAQTQFPDNQFNIHDEADPTHLLEYNANNLTTTRTQTIPDKDGTTMIVGDSHTTLADIGTNTHAQIDTHITNEPAASITTHAAIASAHHAKTVSGDIDHTGITNIGTNTHAQIDTHLAAANPHSGHVDTTGNETVAGIKTFSSFPVTPSSAPTTDYQVANKKYVDDNIGGVTDHGGLSGLGDDDHTQYGVVDASRAFTNLLVGTLTLISDGHASFRTIQNNLAVLQAHATADSFLIQNNARYTTTSDWKYIIADTAQKISMGGGAITLSNAVSGSVNGVVTWIDNVTIADDYIVFNTRTSGIGTNVSAMNAGSIALSNAASSSAAPAILGKSNDNIALLLIAGSNNAQASGDFVLNIRENDNTDFATTTSVGFRFSRFSTTLIDILRSGKMQMKVDGTGGGWSIGAGNDFFAYHDGTSSWLGITSSTGTRHLYLDNADSGHIYARTRGSFRVLDRDNSDAILFDISAAADTGQINVPLTAKLAMSSASVTDDIAIVHNTDSADYGASWTTSHLPTSPVEGMVVTRHNTNAGASTTRRVYMRLGGAWVLIYDV